MYIIILNSVHTIYTQWIKRYHLIEISFLHKLNLNLKPVHIAYTSATKKRQLCKFYMTYIHICIVYSWQIEKKPYRSNLYMQAELYSETHIYVRKIIPRFVIHLYLKTLKYANRTWPCKIYSVPQAKF